MPGPSLIDHLAALENPRQSRKVLFPLPKVLLVVLCGPLAGAEAFAAIRRWGEVHQKFLRRLLPDKAGAPSHDTLNDVINTIDGKTSRCTHNRSKDHGPPRRFCMGTQTKIAQAILDRGSDVLLALKGNPSSLHDEIRRYLHDPAAKIHSRFETTDGDHGRIAVCRSRVSHESNWLTTAHRFPEEPHFPGLRASAVVKAEVEPNGVTSLERRYDLPSLPLAAKLFAQAVGCHWHAGARLHWVLDVVFHQDQPPAVRRRAAEHGDRPAHGHERAVRNERPAHPQGQAESSHTGHRPPRSLAPAPRVTTLQASPLAAV